MAKRCRFLAFLACLFVFVFSTNAFASCSKVYNSCLNGCAPVNGSCPDSCCDSSVSCPSGYTDGPSTYNECNGETAENTCYKNCTVGCSGQATCPEHYSTCTHYSSSEQTSSGTQYYDGSCSANAEVCAVKSFTCDSTGHWVKDGGVCKCDNGYTEQNGTCVQDAIACTTSNAGIDHATAVSGNLVDGCCATYCSSGYRVSNCACVEDTPTTYSCSEYGYEYPVYSVSDLTQCYNFCYPTCTVNESCPTGTAECTHADTCGGSQHYGGTCQPFNSPCTCAVTGATSCEDGYYMDDGACYDCGDRSPDVTYNVTINDVPHGHRTCNQTCYYPTSGAGGTHDFYYCDDPSPDDCVYNNCTYSCDDPGYTLSGTSCIPLVYTITLSDNGGSGGNGAVYLKYQTGWYSNSGATSSISSVSVPTNGTKTFMGYYTASSGGDLVVPANGNLPAASGLSITVDTTLYAHWADGVCAAGQYMDSGTCKSCSTETNGEFPNSDTGISDPAYCYTDCALATNAQTMSGRDYYTATDTCEIVTCAPGYSLQNGQCVTCPAGSVCNPDIGTKTCSELTDDQYTMSDAGNSDVANCYKDCALATNANTMTGRDYYTATDTCEIVTCAPGYSLQNGQCVTCPAGSVCNPDIGTKTCSELTNGQYTMSDAGISDPAYCFADCVAPSCKDPGTPANVLMYGNSPMYTFCVSSVESRMYNDGQNTCVAPDVLCGYDWVMCRGNYYQNLPIKQWDNDAGQYLYPGSEKDNVCLQCTSPYSYSDDGGINGQESCYSNITLNCVDLLPPTDHMISCSYKNVSGGAINGVPGGTYYPGIDAPRPLPGYACYVSTCQCTPGYAFVAPQPYDDTDPGACVPDTFEITLNDNCDGGTCLSAGVGSIFEKYTVGWYGTQANADAETNAIQSVTAPTWTNHTFLGYFATQNDPNDTTPVIPATGSLSGVSNTLYTQATMLYAHWSIDNYTCTAGKRYNPNGADTENCRDGYYCPGGEVLANLVSDEQSGCERKCPTDTLGGAVTSAGDRSLITQCKTTRNNVPLHDLDNDESSGAGDQMCYYDPTATSYTKDCTIHITSCIIGRYREEESSTTCRVVGRGAYSPEGSITQFLCSALNGANSTVTTIDDHGGAAQDCYNVCSPITIDNGSRNPVHDKESYNGTTIPACTYTTACNTGYEASGEICKPRICEVTLNHNNSGCTMNCTTPTSPIFLKYNTGWYASRANAESGTSVITGVDAPNWPGQAFSGYFTTSNQQVIGETGTLTTQYTLCGDNTALTATASWEQKPVVHCAAGTYYTGTGTTCTECPAGSYCGGTDPIQDIGIESGKLECKTTASTYTAATDANGQSLTVSITSAAGSTVESDCYATNVAYNASQGAGSRTCHYNMALGKYVGSDTQPCTDIQILTCTTGHWLNTGVTTTDCTAVGNGWYSPNIVITRTECPNRQEDPTITTQSDTSGSIQECYRGNIWYEPSGGHSGHRRNCYHKADESDTNIATGYTYNCNVPVIVTCDAGYYNDGSYKNANDERDCVPVGDGKYSPAQSACPGEELQPSIDNPGCSTQIKDCPAGTGAENVISETPATGTTMAGTIEACYLTCQPTITVGTDTSNVKNPDGHAYYESSNNKYQMCVYDKCPADMWCDENGPHQCPTDKDNVAGHADFDGQEFRDITKCYIVYDPYVAKLPNYPNRAWGYGTGWVQAYYETATNDYTNPYHVGALTCDAGYYYAGSMTCSDVNVCKYSPAQSAFPNETPTRAQSGSSVREFACPSGCSGSHTNATNWDQCYKTCPENTGDFPHSETVASIDTNKQVFADSADTYPACKYRITCVTGYDVQDNDSATPSCNAHQYTVTLDKNGGTGSTAASVQCVFDSGSCALPAIVDTRTGYSTANKWCTNADGTGTCYNAGTNVATNISADASDITLFAQWTPNVYKITLKHNGAATNGAPGIVYLKYATGWYSDNTATTPIAQMTTKPVKGVMTFAGYSGNDVTVIDSNGNFVTSPAALTFTSANATITAQWADAPITCPAGTYYVGTGDEPTDPNVCKECPEDYYCEETTIQTNSGEAGKEPCPVAEIGTNYTPAQSWDGTALSNIAPNVHSPAGSTSAAACTATVQYVASHGKGQQTCHYADGHYASDCVENTKSMLTCDAGYWRANVADKECSEVQRGNYSGNLDMNRYQCPNGGTTKEDVTTAASVGVCYKPGLDYTAPDGTGTGTQSCWYSTGTGTSAVYNRECFDMVITACRGGYYLVHQNDVVCGMADQNYYSNEGAITQTECPDGGKTRNKATVTVDLCYKDGLAYVAEHGGGSQTCFWNTDANAYNIGCGDKKITYCNGGYWLDNALALDCVKVGYAAYSPYPDLPKYECDPGMTTETETSESADDCFTCPAGSVCNPNAHTCSELTNGEYTQSDAGTTDVAYCYRQCAVVPNAQSMAGRDYYTADDTCEIVACEPGFALENGQCVTCPAGSYCGGEPGDDGQKLCSDLGDGTWMYSAPGSTRETDCYKICAEHMEGTCTLTPVEGTAYWPNDCQFTGTSATGNPAEVINGVCIETECRNIYEMIDGVCELCNRENALSYQPDGNCIVESCTIGYHPNVDQCEPDVHECTENAPNATYAEEKWDASRGVFGVCVIKSCDEGYHLSSNTCVANERVCDIENGVGLQTWNTVSKSWNECVATSCVPGYTNDPHEKNNASQQCSECRNKFSTLGEVAASSYVTGCEIASCMYQGEKYNLDNNECVPICATSYSDETGSLRWNDRTKKCERNCNPGYISW